MTLAAAILSIFLVARCLHDVDATAGADNVGANTFSAGPDAPAERNAKELYRRVRQRQEDRTAGEPEEARSLAKGKDLRQRRSYLASQKNAAERTSVVSGLAYIFGTRYSGILVYRYRFTGKPNFGWSVLGCIEVDSCN